MKTTARLTLLVSGACAFASAALGTTLVRDLGAGLTLYRVHELPADLPSPASGRPGPCVLDLRFAKADAPSSAALKAWVKFNVSVHAPVFVLENSQTEPSLLANFPANGQAGILVLAPVSAKLSPDIGVQVGADLDRRSYQALEKGAAVEALLSDYPDKPRIDESYLEKEHIADTEAPELPADRPTPPLIDPMLQRAVQLYRGLQALKKLG